jgi:hypothetical protein
MFSRCSSGYRTTLTGALVIATTGRDGEVLDSVSDWSTLTIIEFTLRQIVVAEQLSASPVRFFQFMSCLSAAHYRQLLCLALFSIPRFFWSKFSLTKFLPIEHLLEPIFSLYL